jgi:Arc/MetJ-type ribon-helix-helix transcriptional regulator
MLERMTVQVPTRLNGWDVQRLDELVADGVGENRSDVIRLALRELYDAHRRRRIGETIAESYLTTPQTTDDIDLAMANAEALTDAEPW